jgi:hypothetical protein
MTPLLLLGGLAAARQRIGGAVRRSARGLVAYVVLICTGLVALGFFTVGGFLYIMSMWGAVTASVIVAAVYAVIGSICFLTIKMPRTTSPLSQTSPMTSSTQPPKIAAAEGRDLPAIVITVGLLAALGYLAGRSATLRR